MSIIRTQRRFNIHHMKSSQRCRPFIYVETTIVKLYSLNRVLTFHSSYYSIFSLWQILALIFSLLFFTKVSLLQVYANKSLTKKTFV